MKSKTLLVFSEQPASAGAIMKETGVTVGSRSTARISIGFTLNSESPLMRSATIHWCSAQIEDVTVTRRGSDHYVESAPRVEFEDELPDVFPEFSFITGFFDVEIREGLVLIRKPRIIRFRAVPLVDRFNAPWTYQGGLRHFGQRVSVRDWVLKGRGPVLMNN